MAWRMERMPARLPAGCGRSGPFRASATSSSVRATTTCARYSSTIGAFGVPYSPSSTSSWAASRSSSAWATRPTIAPTPRRCARWCGQPISPTRLAPRRRELRRTRSSATPAGELEVVDALVRRVTFDVLGDYFGVPESAGRRSAGLGDAPVRIPVRRSRATIRRCGRGRRDRAGAARAYPDSDRAAPGIPAAPKDDVLGRCLATAGNGRAGLFRRPDPHRAHGLHRRRAAAAADGRAAGARAAAPPPGGAGRRAGSGARATTTSCSPAMCSRRCASIRSPRRCRASR